MSDALYPWPIEEALFRPIVSLLLSLLVPLATERALVMLLAARAETDRAPALRMGLVLSAPLQAMLAAILGVTALGPAWQSEPRGGLSVASMLVCAGFTAAAFRVAMRRHSVVGRIDVAEDVRRRVDSRANLGFNVFFLEACVLIASGWLVAEVTTIRVGEVATASEADAWRRLRVDPWDASATLALGWSARRREDLERASAYADAAEHMGAETPALLELRAELLAAHGDCDEARETFDRAIDARVVDPLAVSLELGGYHIPPTLLTECGMGESP